jgi:hypothetical protein
MTYRSPLRPLLLVGALLAATAVLAPGRSARAADEGKATSSLSLLPADTAFYIASLRNKQQMDAFYKSNAYKALRSLPLVKEGVAKAMEKLKEEGGPLEMYNKFMEDKDNKDLVSVLLQGLSEDCFVYGGASWVDFVSLLMKVNQAQQTAPLQAIAAGNPAEANKFLARGILHALQKDKDKVKVPDTVFGFKVKDTTKAVAQLDRLEKIATKLAGDVEFLKGRVKRVKAAGGDFVTLQVDGSLIPWDMIPLAEFEENKGEFDEIIKTIKAAKLTVSVGVKGDYLLVGLSPTTEAFEKLSGKGKLLTDRDELKPLKKHADKPMASISYGSKALSGAAVSYMANFSNIVAAGKKALEKAPIPLKEERKKTILKDLDTLEADLKAYKPAYGASLAFSYLTDSGYEGYSYAYERGAAFKDVSCKLQNHFGGDPIFAAAFAFHADGSSYATFKKWAKIVHGHAEGAFLETADDDAKEEYKKHSKTFLPLLKQLDDAISKQLIPAMKDCGLGIVVDAKWKSKQWHKELPEMPKEMPMLELGLLLGISDGKKFAGAMKEIRTTLNELYEKVRGAVPNGDNIPEFKIPAPETDTVKEGILYYFAIPEEAGLDKQVQPVAGVGKRVGVLALSKKHAQRLMADTPLKLKNGPLARKGPIVGGFVLNWPAFIDAVTPWVEFAIQAVTPVGGPGVEEGEAKKKAKAILDQAHVVLRVLKAFKGISAATYVENGALVTHSQVVFKDIEAPKGGGGAAAVGD